MKEKLLKITAICALSATLAGCVAAVAGGAATAGLLVAQDRRSTGTLIDDKSLEFKAKKAIDGVMCCEDEPTHITVIAYDNDILLIGQASTQAQKQKAADAIRDELDVGKIHNEIQIAEPTSMLTRSNDAWITTKIKGEMVVHKDLNPARVKVITENGVVYLIGIVKRNEEQVAVGIARHTKGVKKVVKLFEYV